MNDEWKDEAFEMLPFGAGEAEGEGADELEGELEGERGRSLMMRGGAGRSMGSGRSVYRSGAKPGRGPVARPVPGRPGRPRPKPSPPGPRWPRGPYWGPVYGWPGGVMVAEPRGYPPPMQDEPGQDEPTRDAPAPAFEPVEFPAAGDRGGQEDGQDDGQEEIPPEFLATLGALAMPAKPSYTLLGPLLRAPALLKPKTPGFYLIVFPAGARFPGKFRAYSGQSDDPKRRMLEHLLEISRLGLHAPRHKVYIATTSLDEAGRRAIEYALHDRMLRDHFGVLTNPRRELSAPIWQ
jgi:hypothetical protein